MPFSFPSSPTVGQTSTQNGRTYSWSGAAWELVAASGGGSFQLPTASESTLGGVKVGSGLSIADGVLSATGGADAVLRALFVPSAPTGVTATAGNAQAAVSWTAPTGVIAQAPVTDYIVQYSSDSGSTWTTFSDETSATTSATVTSLNNGTAYVFRVAAVNGAGQGAWSSTATSTPVSDAFASSVVAYLRMNGSNGSQTFTDSSQSPKTITTLNATAVTTSVKKYGTGSATNFSYGGIAIANGVPNFSSDFTVECWAYFNPCTSGCYGFLIKPDSCLWRIETAGGGQFMINEGGSNPPTMSVSDGTNLSFPLPSRSEWHHIAFVKQGTTHRIYVDGVEAHNSLPYGPRSQIAASVDNVMYVGGFGGFRWFDGYIDDFRVTNACRYPDGTTFTPPTE
jgi:hypothetical protein